MAVWSLKVTLYGLRVDYGDVRGDDFVKVEALVSRVAKKHGAKLLRMECEGERWDELHEGPPLAMMEELKQEAPVAGWQPFRPGNETVAPVQPADVSQVVPR